MKETHLLSILEPNGIARSNEFVQIGVPLPAGRFFDTEEVQLFEGEKLIPSVRTPSAYWSDKSIRWCLLRFYISLDKHENKKITINSKVKEPHLDTTEQLIVDNTESIEVKTKNYSFNLNKNNFNVFEHIINSSETIAENGFCRLIKSNNESLKPVIKKFDFQTSHSELGPIYSEVSIGGHFQNSSGTLELNFEAIVDFYYESDQVKYSVTLHNPNRANHPSGLWDLGDVNSIFIEEFTLGFEFKDSSEIHWKAETKNKWKDLKTGQLKIYQESSGGDNWDSPNHINKDGRVPMRQKGYTCQHEQTIVTGDRAVPVISVGTGSKRINIKIENFWQNFPKSLGIDRNNIELGLFPHMFPDAIELQPGEKKTHCFYLDLGGNLESANKLNTSTYITLNSGWIDQSKVFPYSLSNIENDPIEEIIKEGLSNEDNFFAKREKIDEYGWRNFGDLYADHESDLYEGNEIFISHYNNQYDPLYGFIHQYLITGENKWFQLADDLARHVTDIDIYHTDKDRIEYSGGAFWHTDHYLDARTSSHRSFSKHHTYVYEGHAGGGGPAEEHCYTTGLMFHYLLTGSESSRKAVLQLSNWIKNIYEGSNTFFELLVGIKKGNTRRLKNIFTGKYSLHRGTGYYVNASLDNYLLTRDRSVLQLAGDIIKNTVHPLDDIDARDLVDVERNWFYTIFFQSVYRYLQIKQELSEFDDDFYYSRDTLLHYADWISKNEYPYMEKPEILEFPNHTWTAQDLRKVNILMFAANYADHNNKDVYLNKATQLKQYIVDKLSVEPTKTYTRILVILMQNYIPGATTNSLINNIEFVPRKEYEPLKPPSFFSSSRNLFFHFISVFRHSSIKKELIWLNKRTQIISRTLARF